VTHGWASCSCPRGGGGLPLVSDALAEKRKCGAKASWKTSVRRVTSARGHRRMSAKVVANSTLLDVEAGASDELPLTIRQSFKDG
jgi:hypothetical protein